MQIKSRIQYTGSSSCIEPAKKHVTFRLRYTFSISAIKMVCQKLCKLRHLLTKTAILFKNVFSQKAKQNLACFLEKCENSVVNNIQNINKTGAGAQTSPVEKFPQTVHPTDRPTNRPTDHLTDRQKQPVEAPCRSLTIMQTCL